MAPELIGTMVRLYIHRLMPDCRYASCPAMQRLQQKLVKRNEERVLLKNMTDDQDGLLYFYCESQPLTTVSQLWRAERYRRLDPYIAALATHLGIVPELRCRAIQE
jgi:hypothetical protein